MAGEAVRPASSLAPCELDNGDILMVLDPTTPAILIGELIVALDPSPFNVMVVEVPVHPAPPSLTIIPEI